MDLRPKITPFLWFGNNAEEAAAFYISLFDNAGIVSIMPSPDGRIISVTFQLEGQQFMALNGGPQFQFTEDISLFVDCDDQAEVDEFWEKLCADGGAPGPCGWLKDRFGLSWQIIPRQLGEMLGDEDPKKAQSVRDAMLQMSKIDVAALQAAYDAA